MKGRATHRDVLQLEPTESELEQEEAEMAAEIAAGERDYKPPNKMPPHPRNLKSRRKTSSSRVARR